MECTLGKGQGKGSTGAHPVPAAWWVVETLQALELPELALCLQSGCPGTASLPENTLCALACA